jgi:hypothetical protein
MVKTSLALANILAAKSIKVEWIFFKSLRHDEQSASIQPEDYF